MKNSNYKYVLKIVRKENETSTIKRIKLKQQKELIINYDSFFLLIVSRSSSILIQSCTTVGTGIEKKTFE